MNSLFSFLKRIWVSLGEPFPDTIRYVRHGLLGRRFPSDSRLFRRREKPAKQIECHPMPFLSSAKRSVDVAVVIPCHNYAEFLPRAVDSVLAQTVRPKEIVVIDDASTDDTKAVTERYASHGVRYVRVEHRNLALTRNSGTSETGAEYLLFLDADDWLRDDYIEKCLEKMTTPKIAVVYADRQHFGDNQYYQKTHEFDVASAAQGNYISSNALIWRQALDAVGGYREIPHSLEDWDFYRRVFAEGYAAARAETLSHIFIHENSMLSSLMKNRERSYAKDASCGHHPITIFTPFAGRRDVFDRYVAGLRALDFDPQMIRLHWYDTSGVPEFGALLRTTLSKLPFGRTTYTDAPLPPFWGQTPANLIKNRIEKLDELEYFYQMAVVRAYNAMITSCDTEYVLTLEDDMRLESQTLNVLLGSFQLETAAVIAPYKSGFYPRYEVWNLREDGVHETFKTKQSGVMEVGGAGCGCTLFRTSMLRAIAPIFTGVRHQPKKWYDQLIYLRLKNHGNILCNWEAEVEHMHTERYREKLTAAFT